MSSILKNTRKIFTGVGGDPSLDPRITNLENNEYKILYFETISSATGTITKPTGATILLDQFYSGGDAIVETLSNGQPTGQSPLTVGGSVVSVSSFDTGGNYTLSGTPSSFPVALVYIFKIKAIDYVNLTVDNIMSMESNDKILGNIPSVAGNIPFSSGTPNTVQSSVDFTYVNNILKLGTPITAGGTYFTDADPICVIARTTDDALNTNSHGFVDATIFKKNPLVANGLANNAFTDNGIIVGSASYDHHAAFQSQFVFNGSNTLGKIYGLVDISKVNSGVVANRYGVYVFDVTGAGTLQNNYGIYVPNLTKGTLSNYGVYVDGGRSLFGGITLFGKVAGRQLALQGDFTASGEMPTGSFMASLTSGNISLTPNTSGGSGGIVNISYFDGAQFRSALEIANLKGAFGTLKLMRSGGSVTIGGGTGAVTNTWLQIGASTTTKSSLTIAPGVAPTTPSTGMTYQDGTHAYMYLAGAWRQLDN